VTAAGFEPSALRLQAGKLARVTFTRTTDETCAKEVVFPDYGIRRPLPLNQAVTVEFTPKTNARAGFVCGMNMLKGTLVVLSTSPR
jgi:plastocyanin domain-containing protein